MNSFSGSVDKQMNKKKKVLVIVIAFFAIIGILFAVLTGIYYYMSHRMQQEIGESMSASYNPNPNLSPP
ncbi:MAG TPA: LapA family protein [Nitrososphaeraceae archaeon]|nr:LapA family protein [Nitrososphaeraceae archaeon]